MSFIREGESERVEFKVEIGNPSELCESIVGFANLRGGDILIGVDDNGVVRGIPEKDSKIEERITYFTREFCSPNVWVTMDTVETKGMRVLVLHVSEGGYGKPFWLKDKGPIIRSGKTDRLMTREEAELSFLDSSLG